MASAKGRIHGAGLGASMGWVLWFLFWESKYNFSKMTGLFGIVSKGGCAKKLFLGADYHSHLGTQFGGMAVLDDEGVINKKIHDIRQSQFKSKFYDEITTLPGKSGIASINGSHPQPLVFSSRFGMFAIATTGLVTNKEELVEEAVSGGATFSESVDGEINTTELVAKLITKGGSIPDGISAMFSKIEGSISLLLLNSDGIYAGVDTSGRFPLSIAKGKGGWAAASETCAFPNLGYTTKKYVCAGEILLLTSKGVKTVRENGCKGGKICSFLWIYTGFPASSYHGINAETVRERCGAALAKKDKVSADMVSGVPDSGVAHAIGYALESKIPYRRPLVKYTPGYGRSYIPPSQEIRDQIALMKLIPNADVISGKRIILCEDSIVRGTQLKNYTINKLYDNKAKEVHVRVACPPLMFPCVYNVSTKTTEELAARKAIARLEGKKSENVEKYLKSGSKEYEKMVEAVRKDIGVTTLAYLGLEEMVKAIGLPREKLCTHCWSGK